MRRLVTLWLSTLLLAGGTAVADAGGWSESKTEQANALIGRFLAQVLREAPTPQPSVALGVGVNGRLVLAKGYGEAAPGMPASEHTIYHVGSLAKQLTAAGVLDLVDRGAKLRSGTALSLDAPLTVIFNGVEHWADADERPVTVRSLLTMTSNLPNFTRRPPAATDPWGRIGAPELLSAIKSFKPWGWPDSFEYSNTSYFLLAEIMEEAIAPGEQLPKAHRDYLSSVIFPRAGMTETGFVGDYAAGTNVASPIHRKRPAFDQPDWLKGSADVASNVVDMFAWNKALMEGRVLSGPMAALMFSDAARVTPQDYYGMGWFIRHEEKRDVFSHSGLVPGFTSYNTIVKLEGRAGQANADWVSVTLLLNSDEIEGLDGLAEDLVRLALN
jgi:CubicO group peptidase (beta-lactamase class C family)